MAREQGLTEEVVDRVTDGFEQSDLTLRDKATLSLTDSIIGDPRSLTPEARERVRAQLADPEIVELSMGVGLFMALSKVLITLGLEPETMPTTVVPTPGSQ